LEAAQEAVRLEPAEPMAHEAVGSAYMRLGRWDEAKAAGRRAIEQRVDNGGIHEDLYSIAFFQHDEVEMRRHVEWYRGRSEEARMRLLEAARAGFEGRLSRARDLANEGRDIALRNDQKALASRAIADDAVLQLHAGNLGIAKREAAEALAIDRGPRRVTLAHVLGLAGDTVQAQSLADDAARTMSTYTFFAAVPLPIARAAIELGRNAPDKAIAALKPAMPYERGKPTIPYLRGLAHLKAGRGSEAATEFQRILYNRGWEPTSVFYPMAQVGLARAAALSGDTAKSRRAYQDFLALWKDADPDVPILIQAKAEYAKLGS